MKLQQRQPLRRKRNQDGNLFRPAGAKGILWGRGPGVAREARLPRATFFDAFSVPMVASETRVPRPTLCHAVGVKTTIRGRGQQLAINNTQ